MTVKELKKLCKQMEREGYGDSILRLQQGGYYNAVEIDLVPNEYGEIVLGVKQ